MTGKPIFTFVHVFKYIGIACVSVCEGERRARGGGLGDFRHLRSLFKAINTRTVN